MQPYTREDEDPGIDGPDYLALVIEWSDQADAAGKEAGPAGAVRPELGTGPARHLSTSRTIAAVLGALGAIALASWGIRRLRSS